jgi:eukaryotic-like serine/threonine-protein kinase
VLGDSIRRRRTPAGKAPGAGTERAPRARPGEAPPAGGRWLHWGGIALVVVGLSFLAGYLLATQVVFRPPETAGSGIAVPDLYGMDQDAAEAAVQALGLRVGTVREVASMRTQAGRVVAQEPLPDQQLRQGAQVSLAVSTGAPIIRVPAVAGLGAETARGLLERAGFDVVLQETRAPGRPGVALSTDPVAGTAVRLPGEVMLVVNLGPELAEPVDSPVPPPSPETGWP